MLSHLAASEGQSQQALSVALGIHRSAVVALVDDLEQRGFAERRRDPVDRRAYTLYLTPAGREMLAELERIADERDVELLSALNASERSRLVSLLAARCRVARPHGGRSSESGAGRRRRTQSPVSGAGPGHARSRGRPAGRTANTWRSIADGRERTQMAQPLKPGISRFDQ